LQYRDGIGRTAQSLVGRRIGGMDDSTRHGSYHKTQQSHRQASAEELSLSQGHKSKELKHRPATDATPKWGDKRQAKTNPARKTQVSLLGGAAGGWRRNIKIETDLKGALRIDNTIVSELVNGQYHPRRAP
jgi:hypothetical protein